ncbi:hypothetical protein CYLTODRAFT_414506 [Cylindrobasidium torrendii FP15055 ss-10]|uniref:Uncharacterized protein n=1 Tax=Cylindrobasidium torrendii FP15055 ss-10 TaxID=1314674 RepID=A0A0D7AX19_9AGAR|nr:hypothetical protein CYLTODRAFT_414506 [Cylindrobasidium torrendii FP15055 ss-10]
MHSRVPVRPMLHVHSTFRAAISDTSLGIDVGSSTHIAGKKITFILGEKFCIFCRHDFQEHCRPKGLQCEAKGPADAGTSPKLKIRQSSYILAFAFDDGTRRLKKLAATPAKACREIVVLSGAGMQGGCGDELVAVSSCKGIVVLQAIQVVRFALLRRAKIVSGDAGRVEENLAVCVVEKRCSHDGISGGLLNYLMLTVCDGLLQPMARSVQTSISLTILPMDISQFGAIYRAHQKLFY